MKPAPFEYRAPESLEEALNILHQYGSDAKLLAGGQSLVPAMNFRVVQPSLLVDLNRIAELSFIRGGGPEGLRMGAMTRERHLERSTLIADCVPLLAEAVPHIAHPQIRNRGTLGGSLVNADPAAELPVIMLALGARLRVQSAERERWVEARDFFIGMFTTDLAPEEMLVEVELKRMTPGTGWSFLEVAPRAGDYALMGVAALVKLDQDGSCAEARLVYLNAGEGPLEAVRAADNLVGRQLDDATISEAADTASRSEMEPFGNLHASADFQRHLAGVLTQRALRTARRRAQEASST